MHRDDLLWLAGLLEGEGCFDLYNYRSSTSRSPYARVRLSMTDEDVVQRVADLWDKNVRSYPPRGTGTKMVYTTALMGADAADLLRKLRPFMGERRTERIDAILAGIA
jgi:hypothetical protein